MASAQKPPQELGFIKGWGPFWGWVPLRAPNLDFQDPTWDPECFLGIHLVPREAPWDPGDPQWIPLRASKPQGLVEPSSWGAFWDVAPLDIGAAKGLFD